MADETDERETWEPHWPTDDGVDVPAAGFAECEDWALDAAEPDWAAADRVLGNKPAEPEAPEADDALAEPGEPDVPEADDALAEPGEPDAPEADDALAEPGEPDVPDEPDAPIGPDEPTMAVPYSPAEEPAEPRLGSEAATAFDPVAEPGPEAEPKPDAEPEPGIEQEPNEGDESGIEPEVDAEPEPDGMPEPGSEDEFELASEPWAEGLSQLDTPIAPLPVAHTHATQNDQRERRMSRVLVVVLACALGVAVVGAGLWYAGTIRAQAEREAYEQAHRVYDVTVPLDAPGYTERATRIPLHVTGTDLDGNAVDHTAYVSGSGAGLSLVQGDYTVRADVSPILADGSLYALPSTEVTISIWADDSGNASPKVTGSLAYAVADMSTVTDEQIEAARDAAAADDESAGSATALAQEATDLRDAAVADAKRAEVARQFATALFTNAKDTGETTSTWWGKRAKLAEVSGYPKACLEYVDKDAEVYGLLRRSYAYAARTDKRGIRDVTVWDPEVEVTKVAGQSVYLQVKCYSTSGLTAAVDYKTKWDKDVVDVLVSMGEGNLVEDYELVNWDEADNS